MDLKERINKLFILDQSWYEHFELYAGVLDYDNISILEKILDKYEAAHGVTILKNIPEKHLRAFINNNDPTKMTTLFRIVASVLIKPAECLHYTRLGVSVDVYLDIIRFISTYVDQTKKFTKYPDSDDSEYFMKDPANTHLTVLEFVDYIIAIQNKRLHKVTHSINKHNRSLQRSSMTWQIRELIEQKKSLPIKIAALEECRKIFEMAL